MALESTISIAAANKNRVVFTPASFGDLQLTSRPYTIAGRFTNVNNATHYFFGLSYVAGITNTQRAVIGWAISSAVSEIQFQEGAGTAIARPGVTQALNTSYHVAGVAISDTLRHIYIDGICAGTNTTNTSFTTPTAIYLMGVTANVSRQVIASECGIWNTDLNSDEINSLASGIKPSSVRPENLIFYAPLVRDVYDIVGGRTYEPSPIAATGMRVATHTRRYG